MTRSMQRCAAGNRESSTSTNVTRLTQNQSINVTTVTEASIQEDASDTTVPNTRAKSRKAGGV